MISVLLSKIALGMELVKPELKKYIKSNDKVVVLPWAFPVEIDGDKLINEYFTGDKKEKYIKPLLDMGIKEENIYIGNCYSDSKEILKKKIKESNVLVLPGGNPEMFFSKVVQECELLYDIKYYKGIIIGESAGCCLHSKRYFITAKNNYYKYFSWYDGFGIIDDPFYMDVHSINNTFYLNKLKSIAKEKKKTVYAIYNDGAIIFNRETSEIKLFGNVKEFLP